MRPASGERITVNHPLTIGSPNRVMISRSQSEITSITQALAILGLSDRVPDADLAIAFRAAAKASYPGREGGDDIRFRQVISAWRLLQAQGMDASPQRKAARPVLPPPPADILRMTVRQALTGGRVDVVVAGRRLRVHVPAGVRTGDRIRLKGAAAMHLPYLPVVIEREDELSAVGADLHMTWTVPERSFRTGGRIKVLTHAGLRPVWVAPGQVDPLRVRLRDLGLPSRGTRPAGHLFITLIPCRETVSEAEASLARFSRAWVPDRLAA